MIGCIRYIDSSVAVDFLMNKHYSGRKPSISLAFGLYHNKSLVAVCTFGKPASNTLCNGIAGKKYSSMVYELNRLCRVDEWAEQLSSFVSACLRCIRNTKQWIVVSYSDTGMGHNGYIYQACNFIYTGATKKRLEFYTPNGHSRHGNKNSEFRQVRTSKHRYVFFAIRSKRLKKEVIRCLNYKEENYPKGENEYYKLGYVFKPEVVSYPKGKKRIKEETSQLSLF